MIDDVSRYYHHHYHHHHHHHYYHHHYHHYHHHYHHHYQHHHHYHHIINSPIRPYEDVQDEEHHEQDARVQEGSQQCAFLPLLAYTV